MVRKTFKKPDESRKVEVFPRADGTFGFEEFVFGQDEDAWFPVGTYSIAIVDSLDHAVTEAKGRIAWLASETEIR